VEARSRPGIVQSLRPTVLFDTLSIFFRAHHALPPMSTTRGEPTGALYGFSSLFLKVVREQNPIGLAFAVDAPQKTFRHERYEAYKATRDATPDAVRQQLGRLDQLLGCLQLPVFRVPGFEGDDILATLARTLRDARAPALVVSGDRDLLQLARDPVKVLFTGARGKEAVLYDDAKVIERFGVRPEQLPSWAALVGDVSDNLPGVRGVGPRTAAQLVQKFHDVPTLLDNVDQVVPENVRRAIAESRDQVRLNEELARLRDDVPLGDGPRSLPLGLEALGRVQLLFAELEFKSLASRVAAIEDRFRRDTGA
jgi:DNA polymerase I